MRNLYSLSSSAERLCRYNTASNPPYNYPDRLLELTGPLAAWMHLSAFTPDAHDLVLSKLVRGDDHDLQQIQELQERAPLSFETMCARFVDEMYQVIGDKTRIINHFLLGVETLFGEVKRDIAEERIRSARAWSSG